MHLEYWRQDCLSWQLWESYEDISRDSVRLIPTAISQVIEQIVNAIVSILGASYLLKVGAEAAKSKNSPLLEPAYGAAGGTLGAVAGAICKPPVCSVCVVCLQGSDETAVKKRSRYLCGKLWKYL